jgi:hypothetical protein
MASPIPEEKRKQIFLALVQLQDSGFASELSRAEAAVQFGIEVAQVKEIEREGIENLWPPL